jgi:hypothetical protein
MPIPEDRPKANAENCVFVSFFTENYFQGGSRHSFMPSHSAGEQDSEKKSAKISS